MDGKPLPSASADVLSNGCRAYACRRLRVEKQAEVDRLTAELAEARKDSERLRVHLMGRGDNGERDEIMALTLRQISGDEPTLDEWRAAIDAAALASNEGNGRG